MIQLVEGIQKLNYDFILLDCPAGIDEGFLNAIAAADEAIVVTTPEITSIRDADRVIGLLESSGIHDIRLMVNRVRPDMVKSNDMMSVRDVQELLSIPLVGAIPEDETVIISTNRGEPLVLNKSLTLSGLAFENAARRLQGQRVDFIDLETPYKTVLQRLQEFLRTP
jgi:septum site-determining protein MinD